MIESHTTIGTETTTKIADENNNEIYIFNQDGTYQYSGKVEGENYSGNGTWSTNGNKLNLTEEGFPTEDVTGYGTEMTIVEEYSINGEILNITGSHTDEEGVTTIGIIRFKKNN